MEPVTVTEKNDSEIARFYAGQSILVTGATGFLGKVLIEKLLRSCPEIETIFILIRNKKNQNIMERTDKLFMDQVFRKLDKAAMAKVMPINGDISAPGLGMDKKDRDKLVEKVSVVFHSAASVRFVDPLKTTLITNLRGTSEMVKLCKEMPKLKSFLYVSTAYSHCVRNLIEEEVYETQMSPDHMLKYVEWMTDEQMEILSENVLGDWPNTYCFSKAMAENYVKKHCTNMPVAIFRPSIVVSCAYEPLPGWNDNLNGPSGIVAGTAMGVIRTMNADIKKNADFVPVDMVANSMIASAWNVSVHKKELSVFNYTSGARNPLQWGQFLDEMIKIGFEAPPSKALWYFCLFTFKNYRLHRLAVFLLHTIPAIMLDVISFLLGKKMRLYKLYQKIDVQTAAPAYFALRQWEFTDTNVQDTISKLSKSDRETFRFDIADLDWKKYMQDYYQGMRFFILKDELSTIPAAVKRYDKLWYMHRGLQVVFGLGSLGLITKLATLAATGVSAIAAYSAEL